MTFTSVVCAAIVSFSILFSCSNADRAGIENNTSVQRAATKTKTIRCKDSRGDDRRLCDFVMSDFTKEDRVTFEAFELTTSEVDLNRDGRLEIVARQSSWAGTSGGSLWILTAEKGRYKLLFQDDSAWTPILILPSEHHGWRDVTFLQTGGGVDTVFITASHDGNSYSVDETRSNQNQPVGEIMIDKEWEETLFGPRSVSLLLFCFGRTT